MARASSRPPSCCPSALGPPRAGLVGAARADVERDRERLLVHGSCSDSKTVRPRLDGIRRQSTFDEVVGGLDESTALFEARRCMSCGSCFACDNCYGVCPDNAVIKLDPTGSYANEVDYDYCKGCGLCAQECPCGAIEMVPEKI